MRSKTIKMVPVNIVPGFRAHEGHHRVSFDDLGNNKRRLLNLNRPWQCRLKPARRVSVAEWRAGR